MYRMVNCNADSCKKQASYNISGEKPKYCNSHKEPNMIMTLKRSDICRYENCKIRAYYNMSGEKPLYCMLHKKDNMINVRGIYCDFENCNTTATYGFVGNNPTRCASHKTEEMKNLKYRPCQTPGCETSANFGIVKGKPTSCVKHKTSDMIDICNAKCGEPNCRLQPRFNVLGQRPIYCANHKKENMFDVVHPTCKEEGCNTRPSFGFAGQLPEYCFSHKCAFMTNITEKLCEHANCQSRILYGIPGNPPTRCATHREQGMIRKPTGKYVVCKNQAFYGENYIPTHCEDHKQENQKNLIERNCVSCNLVMILNKENKCEYCVPETFKKARLAKQNALMDYLDARDLKGTSTDKTINHGECGLERPDRSYETASFILILECDEHQHRERQCQCEQARMVNIGQSYGGTPVYFIRWNPDNYIGKNPEKEPELINKRYKEVGDFIQSILQGKTKLPEHALVSAIYMYYDDWDCLRKEEWKQILAFNHIH